jgi:EAL domain-containing protein (putative c-di-GMP-specific phosphodiesterase class I)
MDDHQCAQATRNWQTEWDCKRLPVQERKMDQSCIPGMMQHASDAKIVRSTSDLALNRGLSALAQGFFHQPAY